MDNGSGPAINELAADGARFPPTLIRVTMRRPTRPFTVEFKSRRKPVQGFISDENGGRLIDEPAPDEVPSRDVSEDAPASAGDDTPFAAANRVFSKSRVARSRQRRALAIWRRAPLLRNQPSHPSPRPQPRMSYLRVSAFRPRPSRPVPRRMLSLRTAMSH